jgi:hypothetical protein
LSFASFALVSSIHRIDQGALGPALANLDARVIPRVRRRVQVDLCLIDGVFR